MTALSALGQPWQGGQGGREAPRFAERGAVRAAQAMGINQHPSHQGAIFRPANRVPAGQTS